MRNVYQREMYHSWLGDKWKKHKYVDRIKLPNGKYRYIYPEDLKRSVKKAKVNVEDALKTAKDLVTWGAGGTLLKKALKNYINDHTTTTTTTTTYDEKKDKEEKPQADKEYKYIAKVRLPNGKWRYFYDKDELAAYYANNGNDVEKALLEEYGIKDKNQTGEEDASEVNERYDEGSEYKNNCYSCSIAYDLRRRGFDVEAIPDYDGETKENIVDCYKHTQSDIKDSNEIINKWAEKQREEMRKGRDINFDDFYKDMSNDMVKKMKSEGNGACGNLIVYWYGGGGHSMVWEVKNNEVIIRDTQPNKIYKGDDITTLLSYTEPSYDCVEWIRTDDKELTEDVLQYVKRN